MFTDNSTLFTHNNSTFALKTSTPSAVPTPTSSTMPTPTIPTQRSAEPAPRELDARLMGAVADGDQAAFSELFVRFSAGVHRIVRAVVRDPAQSDEVVQEVFLTIWREAGRFDPARSSVAGYVTMLARAKAVDRVRASQASRARDERYRVRNIDRHDHYDPVIEIALLHEERSHIRMALTGLTRFQREAIELHYLDCRTYVEVGRLLGVSAATVKSRVRSGVASLRIRLAEPDEAV